MQLSKILLICMGLLYSHTLIADCVVLLHGLARTADAMQDLEDALTAEQFRVANIDYPSREKTIAELAPGKQVLNSATWRPMKKSILSPTQWAAF